MGSDDIVVGSRVLGTNGKSSAVVRKNNNFFSSNYGI